MLTYTIHTNPIRTYANFSPDCCFVVVSFVLHKQLSVYPASIPKFTQTYNYKTGAAWNRLFVYSTDIPIHVQFDFCPSMDEFFMEKNFDHNKDVTTIPFPFDVLFYSKSILLVLYNVSKVHA